MREQFCGFLKQSEEHSVVIMLLDNLGDPVLGLVFSDLIAKFIREGDTALMNFNLSALNFTELADGLYMVVLDNTITAKEGNLKLLFSGASINDLVASFIVEANNPGNVEVEIELLDGINPLPNTQIDIWDNNQTVMLWSGVSNDLGKVTVALNPGNYKVLLRRYRTVFTVPESLTVVGPTAESITYSGAEIPIVPSSDPDVCIIYGYIFDITGTPDDQVSPESIVISAQRTRTPVKYGNRFFTLDKTDVRASSDGYFEITLARSIMVKLSIPRIGVEKTFTVPDEPTVDLATII